MEISQELKDIMNPSRTALLVWDVQNRLVNTIFNRDIFLSTMNKIVSKAREIDVPVIFSKSTPLPEKFQSPVMKFIMKDRFKKMAQVPGGLDLTIEPIE
ncbi:MAG: isochorismatase family protein, partial [Endomicrobiales bacterium]